MPNTLSIFAANLLQRPLRFIGRLKASHRHHKAIEDLMALDDHLLKDIGLARSDLRFRPRNRNHGRGS